MCPLLRSNGSQSPTFAPGDIWPGGILVVTTWVGATGISGSQAEMLLNTKQAQGSPTLHKELSGKRSMVPKLRN